MTYLLINLVRFAHLLSNERKLRLWKNNADQNRRAIPHLGINMSPSKSLQNSWNNLVNLARSLSTETKLVLSKNADILRPLSQLRITPKPAEKWNTECRLVDRKLTMKSVIPPTPIIFTPPKLFCKSPLSAS